MARDDYQQRIKEMAANSLIRKYTNGYEAHYIDKHPRGETYRDPSQPLGYGAYSEEKIMLLNSCWCVVVFLETMEDLERIEGEMKLIRVE